MRNGVGRSAIEVKPDVETFAKIKVIGVGGSGSNAINRMIESGIRGIEFVAINTDQQDLQHSKSTKRLHIGKATTRGLGAGMDPELGRKAAEESHDEIHEMLKGSDMVFITCGLGGGTGTGAAPIIADIAKDVGALTVAVVTKPFMFEGAIRNQIAESGMQELADKVDSIISIPNDRILQITEKKTPLLEAFRTVDDVLRQGVQGIAELITVPGLINVDFADVKAIMENTGSALMGIGEASGDNRSVEAAKAAIDSPLLEMSIDGAKGILFTVTGADDLGMHEVNEAARVITAQADPNAKVVFGTVIDPNAGDNVKITVIATGFGKSGKLHAMKKIVPEETFRPMEVSEQPKPAFREMPLPQREPVPAPRPMRSVPNRPFTTEPEPAKVGQKSKEEQELEIPAFIRKKMM
ncbi:MAG: cell division protein FtsZ [Candidatus Kerfeldbacteria bacterium]|nr:cell division protein FtsZ [Candidatus Kerfeldbacteria bacterium]